MLQAVHNEEKQYLAPEDISRLPCISIDQIDRLWRKFSNHHFGFSIQYPIWQSAGGNYQQIYCSDQTFEQYTTQLGWCIKDEQDYLLKNEIYSIDAPKGHLPLLCYCGMGGLWVSNMPGCLTQVP